MNENEAEYLINSKSSFTIGDFGVNRLSDAV